MDKEKPTISEIIADFALSLRLEDTPKEVIEHGKILMTDTFGVAMSCQNADHAIAIRKMVIELGSATYLLFTFLNTLLTY